MTCEHGAYNLGGSIYLSSEVERTGSTKPTTSRDPLRLLFPLACTQSIAVAFLDRSQIVWRTRGGSTVPPKSDLLLLKVVGKVVEIA